MTEVGIATLVLIITNIFCSLQGLNNRASFKRNNFEINRILAQKDYRRLLTSGFFHVNGLQLTLNMVTLYLFVGEVGSYLGEAKCLFIYFASLLGGNLFSLFIYRGQQDYSSAVGASGAITGIVFASMVLVPGFDIGLLGKHFPIHGWFYGLLYVLVCIYGIKSKKDNIGYETQLAGGLTGIAVAVFMQPATAATNYGGVLLLIAATVFLMVVIIMKPQLLLVENQFFEEYKRRYIIENILDPESLDHEQEIDLILEKIYQNGIGSLSKKEKEKLDYYSKIIQ